MALDTTTNRVEFAGNGVTTAFSFPYYFIENADLVVTLVSSAGVPTVKTITTHYTVSGAGDEAGGTVTMITAPASGETLIIYRDPALTQGLDLAENDDMPAEELEKAYDRAMMVSQRLDSRVDRALRLNDGDITQVSTVLPTPVAGQGIRWNSGLTALEAYDPADAGELVLPAGTGMIAYSGSNTFLARTLTAGTALTITNGDGQSGNPTIGVTPLGIAAASIAADAVTTAKILDSNVTTAKIADLNVTTGKINDLAVTSGKLAADSVITAKILDSNVTTAKIADLNVTTGKINDLAVTTGKINDLAVTTGKLAAGVAVGLTTVTGVPTDYVVISDTSDSGNIKKALISDIIPDVAFRATNPSSTPQGSDTVVVFQTEGYDTASAYDNTTGIFTVPAGMAGKYWVHAVLGSDGTFSAGNTAEIYIQHNGTKVANGHNIQPGNYTGLQAQATALLNLAASDTVKVSFASAGSALAWYNNANGGCVFEMARRPG